jgi:hypothetical protein
VLSNYLLAAIATYLAHIAATAQFGFVLLPFSPRTWPLRTAHADASKAPSSGSCLLSQLPPCLKQAERQRRKKRPRVKTTIFEVHCVGLCWGLGHQSTYSLSPLVDAVRRPDYCVHLADIYLRRRTWIMMLIGHRQPWRGGSTVIILSDLPR